MISLNFIFNLFSLWFFLRKNCFKVFMWCSFSLLYFNISIIKQFLFEFVSDENDHQNFDYILQSLMNNHEEKYKIFQMIEILKCSLFSFIFQVSHFFDHFYCFIFKMWLSKSSIKLKIFINCDLQQMCNYIWLLKWI